MADLSKLLDSALVKALSEQAAVDPKSFLDGVINECFGGAASPMQLLIFLSIARKRHLDPFAKEIFAFVNKKGKMTIGTGIDGWIRIAHEHPDFEGFEHAEVYDSQDKFIGVNMRMFRKGFAKPGEYTAYLEEWNKQVLNEDGWRNQPRHLTFVKAWQECTRFTFAVTDVVDVDDLNRIRQAEGGDTKDDGTGGPVIYQPAPPPQAAIEHNPPEVANFIKTDQPEAVPVAARGHLRVVLNPELAKIQELPRVNVTLPGKNQEAGTNPRGVEQFGAGNPELSGSDVSNAETESSGPDPATEKRNIQVAGSNPAPASNNAGAAGSNKNVTLPGEIDSTDIRQGASLPPEYNQATGRDSLGSSQSLESGAPDLGPCQFKGCTAPATQPVTVKGQTWSLCDAHKEQVAPTPKRRGRPAGSVNKPKDEPTPADAQIAAGLEVIDPNERPLETFCRARELTAWLRVQLDKRGLDKVEELSPEDEKKLMEILNVSMRIRESI